MNSVGPSLNAIVDGIHSPHCWTDGIAWEIKAAAPTTAIEVVHVGLRVQGWTDLHRLQLFADSFRDHQVKCMSHTPATPLIMHLDYAEFTQTLIHVKVTVRKRLESKWHILLGLLGAGVWDRDGPSAITDQTQNRAK